MRWCREENDGDDDDDGAVPVSVVSIGMGMAWMARLEALTVGLSRSDHRLGGPRSGRAAAGPIRYEQVCVAVAWRRSCCARCLDNETAANMVVVR